MNTKDDIGNLSKFYNYVLQQKIRTSSGVEKREHTYQLIQLKKFFSLFNENSKSRRFCKQRLKKNYSIVVNLFFRLRMVLLHIFF